MREATKFLANYSIELAQVASFEPTLNPPINILSTTLTQNRPQIPINPPLVITPGQANVILVDFNVLRMLGVKIPPDNSYRRGFPPSITNAHSTVPVPSGYGELDDLWGFVRTITPTPIRLTRPQNLPLYGKLPDTQRFFAPSTSGAPAVTINISANSSLLNFC